MELGLERLAGRKNGFLVAVLAALVMVGVPRWAKKTGIRIKCEKRYLRMVQWTMHEVDLASGLVWKKGTRITLRVVPGTRQKRGYWQVLIKEPDGREAWHAAWMYAGTGLIGLAADPQSMAIEDGHMSPLGHELAHVLYYQHRIPAEEHHGRMKRDGILWEQR